MSAVLVTSPVAEVRLRFALSKLQEWQHESEAHIITTHRSAGDDLVRSNDLPAARGGFHRRTPLQYALELAAVDLADQGVAPVGGIALQALTSGAIRRAMAQENLDYFRLVSDTVGFTTALERTLVELRLETVRPDALDRLSLSGKDLALLLDCFEQELASGKLADPAAIFCTAASHLETSANSGSMSPTLLLDIQPSNRAEMRFLRALADDRREIVAIAAPGQGRAMRLLEAALNARAQPIGAISFDRSIDRVRGYVFTAATPEVSPPDDTVTFFSATDEGRECVEIARCIQRAADAGTRFDSIAILLRDPDTYQPLVEDALSRAEIPAFFTRASKRPSPSGRAFLSLLACRAENFSAMRFAEYLSLDQVPAPDDAETSPSPAREWVPAQGDLFREPLTNDLSQDGGLSDPSDSGLPVQHLPAPDRWEQLLVDASVVAGRERWQVRLDGLHEELIAQIREVASDDEAHREYLQRQVLHLERLRSFALPVIGALAALPSETRWGDWLEHLEALARSTLSRPDYVLAVLAELRPMNQIGPVALEDVERVLRDRLSMLRSEPPPRRYGRVFVASIDEAAARAFDIVFLPGLSEGLFPRKPREDPLLPDVHRLRLAAGLSVNEDRINAERELLRLGVGCAKDRLLVSYARTDLAHGKARVPSFYALEILRAAEGSIPDLAQLEQRAIESSRSRLGWPSPRQAGDAIDDAEYDLATIAGLLHKSPTSVRGHARYLLESHDGLARSLRSRARRWKNFWSSADGLVDPGPGIRETLRSYGLSAHAHSPTALEQLAVCPYKFFLRAIHKLHRRAETARLEQLDPLTRGHLFHTVQYRLLSELRDGHLPVRAENIRHASECLDRILDETAAEYGARLAPAIPRVWESEIEAMRADLRGWLRREAERRDEGPGWTPRWFEFAFGLPGNRKDRDPASTPDDAVLDHEFRLKGAIDLIEQHAGTHLLRIVDHKTGRPPSDTPRATGRGETLQPVLYALAAEVLLEETVSVSKLSFCTQKGDYRDIEIPVDENARRQAYDTLTEIEQLIQTGFFPAAPRPGACLNCEYRIVCGPYEELRTSRKKQERLEGLARIRQIR